MKYFIITGTSRGLGEALARRLLSPEHHLLCISRNRNVGLIAESEQMDYFEFDLNDIDQVDSLMRDVFTKIDESKAEAIYLINNAAVVTPLSSIEHGRTEELTTNVHVNLLAPILLTSLFIRFSEHLRIPKRVINVSSMSSKNHLSGMSVYSAAKAGLDVFSKCVGNEQGEGTFAVKVISVWPGMIDTSLQEEARRANKDVFAASELFNRVKDEGMLASPATIAEKLVDLLLSDQFAQGIVVEEL